MDTRRKILTAEQAVAAARQARAGGARVTLVSGHFDPLLPANARRLGELAEPEGWLLVVITDPAKPILPAQARAELVAALRGVDGVVVGAGAASGIPAHRVFHEESEDVRRAEEFVAHVRARMSA